MLSDFEYVVSHLRSESANSYSFLRNEETPGFANQFQHCILIPGPETAQVDDFGFDVSLGQFLSGFFGLEGHLRPGDDCNIGAASDEASLTDRDSVLDIIGNFALCSE